MDRHTPPFAWKLIQCSMPACDNDADRICERCNELVCGSCFNGEHEWTEH